MLFKRQHLDGVVVGTISLAFRRWKRPTVRAGGTLRTAVGILAIDAVDVVSEAEISENDARCAGYSSRVALLEQLKRHDDGLLYRIELHFAGPDPREELRQRDTMTDDELTELQQRLARLDSMSRHGSWTKTVLALIANRPGTRATELAVSVGFDTAWFKVNVRKLKELGLTESLTSGYRLSPRGQALLNRLDS